ncbi:hypothetical protein BaRGS_00005434 [Batillaria attramentaria]|uniref:Uncharacterized protein n=1 Tax=Batillaria attramentaria TaxID=370345 RepID=A0ABD0LVU9_9CAEN
MEYSSNKPLALQVYKTAAEFKAHRLNRSEQSRLNTARFSISKEARSLEKDFRLTKAKLESQFRRRFSVHDTSLASTSAVSTPSRLGEDAFSLRRGSQIHAGRRHSEWSIADSMARGRLLQRRQTVGGAASALPGSRSYGGRSRLSAAGLSDCDFCEKVSQIMDQYAKTTCQNTKEANVKKYSADVNAGVSREDGAAQEQHLMDVDQKHDETTSKNLPRRTSSAVVNVIQENGITGGTKSIIQSRLKARSAFYPRRASKPASVRYADCADDGREMDETDGVNHGLCNGPTNPTVKISAEKDASERQTSPDGNNTTQKTSLPDAKSDQTPSEDTENSPRQNHHQHHPPHVSLKDFEDVILDHAQNCPSGIVGRSRLQSVAFEDLRGSPVSSLSSRRTSAPTPRFILEGRVSEFLDQQQEFNKRFPLKRHDVTSLQCARPDLLNASRKQDELEKRNKRKKADMIEEVMNKLGLARTNCDGSDTGRFPSIKKQ